MTSASLSPSKPTSKGAKTPPKPKSSEDPSQILTPRTPGTSTLRCRSARRASLQFDPVPSPTKDGKREARVSGGGKKCGCMGTLNSESDEVRKNSRRKFEDEVVRFSLAPVSPDKSETKKRKGGDGPGNGSRISKRKEIDDGKRKEIDDGKGNKNKKRKGNDVGRGRSVYKKVVFDGGDFEVGDDVYVKRKEEDEEDLDVEECRICFEVGTTVMIECDFCLGGFHLNCLSPPLEEVPEGDWLCQFCKAQKLGKKIELLKLPEGKKRARTAREKLLAGDLWAARIESMWKDAFGKYWCRVHWYMIPEETSAGRQPHNLRRELYKTNDFANIEMESVLKHCSVKAPKEYAKANDDGDDVFLCEYEYDIHLNNFKRVSDVVNEEEDGGDNDRNDEDWACHEEACSDNEDDFNAEIESVKKLQSRVSAHGAANLRKGHLFELGKVGTEKIPEHVRLHKISELERAKIMLHLSTPPKNLPCRNKEMEEITSFLKGAVCVDQCLGRCLYIHGVPGTGKTMSVISVMRNLRTEVEDGNLSPYSFVNVNGLKLASPENIYRVIYEALTGHKVHWKKALNLLNERFSGRKQIGKYHDKPIVLLIDELDLLVTRNQSVLYNILDWPTKPHSKLVVIGIANTMDLPEKLLPRISSRMGIQRLCFGPYNYQQLQEIISTRLKGINAFEKQAIEFTARKVAAISGDARRALEICRRAAEVADYRIKENSCTSSASGKTLVGMKDVETAIQEMFQAPHIQVMKTSCKFGKIFLTAMVHELYKTGMAETTFEKLAVTVSCLCTSNGEKFPGWDTLLKIGCMLGECRILLCEPVSKHRLQKLQLNFPSDDVSFALKDSQDLPWLAKYL